MQRQHSRKLRLYFDQNDEFVNEDCIKELLFFNKNFEADDSEDAQDMEFEVMRLVNRKYHSVVVNFGSEEEQLAGTTRITRDIFIGGDKNENALLFLENLDKVKQTKKPAIIRKQNSDQDSESSHSDSKTAKTAPNSEELICQEV